VTKSGDWRKNSGRSSRARPVFTIISQAVGQLPSRRAAAAESAYAAQRPHVLPREPGVPGPGCPAPDGRTRNTAVPGIGTGLSTMGNAHEVAQWAAPGTRAGACGQRSVALANVEARSGQYAAPSGEAYFYAMAARKP
jgi:hypothetical protein